MGGHPTYASASSWNGRSWLYKPMSIRSNSNRLAALACVCHGCIRGSASFKPTETRSAAGLVADTLPAIQVPSTTKLRSNQIFPAFLCQVVLSIVRERERKKKKNSSRAICSKARARDKLWQTYLNSFKLLEGKRHATRVGFHFRVFLRCTLAKTGETGVPKGAMKKIPAF